MVTREELRARGLRAYELGRLRTAARVALYLVPLALLCFFETGAREPCVCLGVLLLGTSLWLRWRDRRGMADVTTGLVAGGIPLFAGLAIGRFAPMCASSALLSACTAFCVATGALAGVWIALRESRSRARFASWAAATSVALLAASLGCIKLGVTHIVGVTGGMILVELCAALVLRSRQSLSRSKSKPQ